jgi:hypothetical protein
MYLLLIIRCFFFLIRLILFYSNQQAEFSSSDVTVGPYDEVNELLGETEDKISNNYFSKNILLIKV